MEVLTDPRVFAERVLMPSPQRTLGGADGPAVGSGVARRAAAHPTGATEKVASRTDGGAQQCAAGAVRQPAAPAAGSAIAAERQRTTAAAPTLPSATRDGDATAPPTRASSQSVTAQRRRLLQWLGSGCSRHAVPPQSWQRQQHQHAAGLADACGGGDAARAAGRPNPVGDQSAGARCARGGATRLPAPLLQDLVRKGYVRPRPAADGPPLCPCVVFAIIKSCGTELRMIWDGRDFNKLCWRPPRFSVTPFAKMLSVLLRPDVHSLVTWDFRTWFLEWILHPAVRAYFTTIINGVVHDLEGGPMGWSWACVIAQSMTAAFSRAVLVQLGRGPTAAQFEFCIDNTGVAIIDPSLTPDALMTAVREVARRTGIVIKPSSVEMGDTVDWLCYTLRRTTSDAVFKKAYVERLRAAQSRVRNGARQRDMTLQEVWSVLGLLVVTVYAAGWPFRLLKAVFLWMKEHAPPPGAPERWGDRVPFPHPRFVSDMLRALAAATVVPRPLPGGPTAAWAVADASGKENNAVVIFLPAVTIINIYRCEAVLIAERELCAQVSAMRTIADHLTPVPPGQAPAAVHLFCDNEVATAAAERGSSVSAHEQLGLALEEAKDELEQRLRAHCSVHPVRTQKCLADPWTRGTRPTDYVWPRTCDHPFGVGQVCDCILAHMRETDAPMERVLAFVEDPPAWGSTSDPLVEWCARGIVQ